MSVRKIPFSKNRAIFKPGNYKKWAGSYMLQVPTEMHLQKDNKLKATRTTFS